ncbi:MAG: glycosyl transferase [Planctomycetaceae bacterium]|nr:glycosyl transferase [Planctomycetaceae bacterium]
MSWEATCWILLVAFLASCVATRALVRLLARLQLMDIPNTRSSHSTPTPRGGGLGILIGITAACVAAWALNLPLPNRSIFFGVAIVASLGFLDDVLGGIGILIRLLAQALAAYCAVYTLDSPVLPLSSASEFSTTASLVLTLIWIVGVTNVYNFLDGIDGYAGFQGVIAGLAIAFVGQGAVSVVGLSIAGACLGFLIYNWHPARVFMGDVGSNSLGFLISVLPLHFGPEKSSESLFAVAMCMWFFLADGTFTLCARVLRRERFWEPHRRHLYQRLVQTGLRHDQVVCIVGLAATTLATLAVISVKVHLVLIQWSVVALSMIAFVAYHEWTRYRERSM